jgi:iron complex outermembrane receptor protein
MLVRRTGRCAQPACVLEICAKSQRANSAFHLIVLAALAAGSRAAQGQQAPATDAGPIQEVIVTGSYIKRTQTETSNPVQIISAEEMKAFGYTSTQQVLQSLTANGQG